MGAELLKDPTLTTAVANARLRGALARLARDNGRRIIWPSFEMSETADRYRAEADSAS
jgi:hypothetical protein